MHFTVTYGGAPNRNWTFGSITCLLCHVFINDLSYQIEIQVQLKYALIFERRVNAHFISLRCDFSSVRWILYRYFTAETKGWGGSFKFTRFTKSLGVYDRKGEPVVWWSLETVTLVVTTPGCWSVWRGIITTSGFPPSTPSLLRSTYRRPGYTNSGREWEVVNLYVYGSVIKSKF